MKQDIAFLQLRHQGSVGVEAAGGDSIGFVLDDFLPVVELVFDMDGRVGRLLLSLNGQDLGLVPHPVPVLHIYLHIFLDVPYSKNINPLTLAFPGSGHASASSPRTPARKRRCLRL